MSDSDGPRRKTKTTSASDDLLSVTVRKESLNEKSGITLVERQGVVYVTKITENGLFHNTAIGVGDVVLSINGKRLKKGEGPGEAIKAITQAKATVTVVVKKSGKKPTRGSRSLSPRTRRKKKRGEIRHTELLRLTPNGSLDVSYNPTIAANKSDDDEEVFEQYTITGTKLFANQAAGLNFQEEDNKLFVSNIAGESIFRDTELEVGDRVCLINEMNFMTYANGGYAKTVLSKATSNVDIVVEKGHKTDLVIPPKKSSVFNPLSPRAFTSPQYVKPKLEINLDSSGESSGRKPPHVPTRGRSNVSRDTSFESPRKLKYAPKLMDSPSPLKSPTKPEVFESPGKIKHAPKLMDIPFKSPTKPEVKSPTKPKVFESPRKMKSATKLMESPIKSPIKLEIVDGDYGHDFMRVTVKKISERKSGVSVTKTEGKFILTAVPDYEKRISVGDEVLAINGTRNINTVIKAEDLMKRTKGSVVLIVNFDSPKDFECPCCGKAMTCKGGHVKCKGSRGKYEGSVTESVATAQAGNIKGPKKPKVRSIPEIPLRYNMADYDSESASDDESEESELIVDEPKQDESSRYSANDKFMVNVTKTSRNRDHGITLLEYQGEYYVSGISKSGLFYNSPINKGDKIVSINGKKSAGFNNAAFAEGIMDDRDSIGMFVLRPDPTKAEYQAVLTQIG